jgi:hypothetical protein
MRDWFRDLLLPASSFLSLAGGDGLPAEPAPTPALAANDGTAAWFSDPRAIVTDAGTANEALFFTSVSGTTSGGNVEVHRVKNGQRDSFLLIGKMEVDDHDNGCILQLSSGRIVCFYGKHTETSAGTRYRVSLAAAPNIGGFGPEKRAQTTINNSYQVAFLLGDGNIYLFRRNNSSGGGAGGRSWELLVDTEAAVEAGTAAFATREIVFQDGVNRPYAVFAKNGANRIDVFTTNGHPAEMTTCSLYHGYFSVASGSRKWHTSNGTEIVSALPHTVSTAFTNIQSNTASNINESWTAQVRIGADGLPRCLSTRYPSTAPITNNDIEYWHHRWTGVAWVNTRLSQNNRSLYAGEEFYAPLLCFDGNDTSAIFMAENDDTTNIAEINKYTFDEGTTTLTFVAAITSASATNNIRPFSPIGHGVQNSLIWRSGTYTTFTAYEMNTYILGEITALATPGAYETETDALVARMSVAPSTARKNVINRRIQRLKAGPYSSSNIWGKKGVDYVFQAHDAQAARLNWKGSTGDLTVSGTPVFTTNRGYKGTAVAGDVLNSLAGTAIPQWTQNGAHVHALSEWTGATGSIIRRSAAGAPILLNAGANATNTVRINNGTGVILPNDIFIGAQGSVTSSRTGASTGTVYKDGGVIMSDGTTAAAVDSATLLIAYQHSGGNIMAVSMGGTLTQAEVADMVFADWEYSRDARS